MFDIRGDAGDWTCTMSSASNCAVRSASEGGRCPGCSIRTPAQYMFYFIYSIIWHSTLIFTSACTEVIKDIMAQQFSPDIFNFEI